MGIMIEAAGVGERGIQRLLSGMAERRMAEVVGQAKRLGQVFIEAQRASDRPADLRDFDAMRQANAVMIAVRRDEHLGLVAQAAERDRMDDAVAVALEDVARASRASSSSGCSRPRDRDGFAASASASVIERHDGVARGIRPAESVDIDLLRSSANVRASSVLLERPDQQSRTVRRAGDIAADALEHVRPSRFHPAELGCEVGRIGPACELQPDALPRGAPLRRWPGRRKIVGDLRNGRRGRLRNMLRRGAARIAEQFVDACQPIARDRSGSGGRRAICPRGVGLRRGYGCERVPFASGKMPRFTAAAFCAG